MQWIDEGKDSCPECRHCICQPVTPQQFDVGDTAAGASSLVSYDGSLEDLSAEDTMWRAFLEDQHSALTNAVEREEASTASPHVIRVTMPTRGGSSSQSRSVLAMPQSSRSHRRHFLLVTTVRVYILCLCVWRAGGAARGFMGGLLLRAELAQVGRAPQRARRR